MSDGADDRTILVGKMAAASEILRKAVEAMRAAEAEIARLRHEILAERERAEGADRRATELARQVEADRQCYEAIVALRDRLCLLAIINCRWLGHTGDPVECREPACQRNKELIGQCGAASVAWEAAQQERRQ